MSAQKRLRFSWSPCQSCVLWRKQTYDSVLLSVLFIVRSPCTPFPIAPLGLAAGSASIRKQARLAKRHEPVGSHGLPDSQCAMFFTYYCLIWMCKSACVLCVKVHVFMYSKIYLCVWLSIDDFNWLRQPLFVTTWIAEFSLESLDFRIPQILYCATIRAVLASFVIIPSIVSTSPALIYHPFDLPHPEPSS